MKHECFNININGNVMVSRQTFDGTNELAKYIKTAPTNEIWRGKTLSSKKKKTTVLMTLTA